MLAGWSKGKHRRVADVSSFTRVSSASLPVSSHNLLPPSAATFCGRTGEEKEQVLRGCPPCCTTSSGTCVRRMRAGRIMCSCAAQGNVSGALTCPGAPRPLAVADCCLELLVG